MTQKQYTVSLTIGFISADAQNCSEDAKNFTNQLSELLGKFKLKSEEISKHFLTQGPIDVPAETELGQSLKAAMHAT